MNWFTSLNIYCERSGAGFWHEPINALTNLIFILAGFILVLKTRPNRLCIFLSLQIIFIGIASFLFHTFANILVGLIDAVSIMLFGVTYIFGSNLYFLKLSYVTSLIIAVCLLPFSFVVSQLATISFGTLNGSTWYFSFIILFLTYSYVIRKEFAQMSAILFSAALFLSVSIIFRSIDIISCNSIPVGTHFVWHIMNGILLWTLVWGIHQSISREEKNVKNII